ncbi:MAG: hypothetical protein M3619_00630 [Myxococcota bacterium]|nr:hypothetical protein [Myxococcota bacterium]
MSPVITTIPTNLRRPGAFHEFKFLASGQQLVPLDRRVAIVAEKSAAGTAVVDTPVQIFDEDDADTKAGKGSLAALMARAALLQAKLGGGGSPEIWICPVAENAGGTAAIYTVTLTGPATSSGEIVLTVGGRIVAVGVTAGDTATAMALAIKNKIDELKTSLPVTATVALGVVTMTFITKGTNGNDVERSTVQVPAGVTVVHANPTPGAGATAITNAIAALYDRRYHLVALANHSTADAAAILADAALAWGFNQKSYRFYVMGERGSLGTAQTLQASYNDYRVLIGSYEGTPSLPGEIAVSIGVAWFAKEAPNANLDGERVGLYPPIASLAYTATEIESALAGGVIPLTPDGTFSKIERLVTSQITSGGVSFEPLRDAAYPRTASYMAEQIDIGFLTGFKQEVLYDDPDGDDVLSRIRDMVVEKHRAAEKARYIRDVDSFLEQIQVVIAGAPAGRVIVSDPFRVAGPLHQGAFVHSMYL